MSDIDKDSRVQDENEVSSITIVNQKDTLKTFIERSPLGVQFAMIALFHMANSYYSAHKKESVSKPEPSQNSSITVEPFSFTSMEFLNAYSQLALETGLVKYLARHLAFGEFVLTLEYLAVIREDTSSARYEFKVSFDDLKWMASIALQQIIGGQSLSSPEIFYPSPPRDTFPPGTHQPSKIVNPLTFANTDTTAALVRDLSQSIFSVKETEMNRGGGTSTSVDDIVRPRSTDYGLYRPYFQHRVPPTTYSFRKPDNHEWKKIIAELFEGKKCITCNAQTLPEYFDIWIGEPLDDNATPSPKRDQRMTEVLADIDDSISYGKHEGDHLRQATIQQEQEYQQGSFINSNYCTTDRELLTYGYGIIPMDGRDAFIAFAKPKLPCPNCGTDPANSVSLMPKY